jgi:hypothetical protein
MHTTFPIKVYVVQTSINFIFLTLTLIRCFGLNLIHGKLELHNVLDDARLKDRVKSLDSIVNLDDPGILEIMSSP